MTAELVRGPTSEELRRRVLDHSARGVVVAELGRQAEAVYQRARAMGVPGYESLSEGIARLGRGRRRAGRFRFCSLI